MQGIYLVTDRALCGSRTMDEVIIAAVGGGARYVQLREKNVTTRFFVEEARRIKLLLKPFRVPLIINDRVDVALAAGAEGVHLGQDDMPCSLARKLLGRSAVIGLSVECWEDVVRAQEQDVDYLGVSPVFPTPTKTDTKGCWELSGLAKIKAYSRHPLVAIGGINEANAAATIGAGADCLAVVAAICAACDPRQAAEKLAALIASAQASRSLHF